MPRPPNPKSKTSQYVMGIKTEWETEFRAMKEICARNGLKLNEEIYERAVRSFLRDHDWPPGNSQTVLPSFGVQTKITQQCEYPHCVNAAKFEDTARHGGKIFFCQQHHEHAVENRLLKKSKQL